MWGKIKPFKNNKKSLEGTLSFILSTFLCLGFCIFGEICINPDLENFKIENIDMYI